MSEPTPPEPHYLSVDLLLIDANIQPRVKLNNEAIKAYSERYALAEPNEQLLPPLDVFCIDGRYIVADGVHRLRAAQRAQVPALHCLVHEGTHRDAMLFAIDANGKHGVQYTWGDKELILKRVLDDEELRALKNREIARRFHISHTYVNTLRKEVDIIRTFKADLAAALETVSTTPAGTSPEQVALANVLGIPPEVIHALQKNRANTIEVLTDRLVFLSRQGQGSYDTAKSHLAQALLAESRSRAPGRRSSQSRRKSATPIPGQIEAQETLEEPSETARTAALRMVATTFGGDVSAESLPQALRPSPDQQPIQITLPGASGATARAVEGLLAELIVSHIVLDAVDPEHILGTLNAYVIEAASRCSHYITELRHFQTLLHTVKPGQVLLSLIAHLTAERLKVNPDTARKYTQAIEILKNYATTQLDPDHDLSRRVVEL